ncbi:titin homolog isoform X3 [Hibiscus syriacus]|uniref:titin homolog isoform X3 n=1 Tax=Hibiscus syriacus TaxID=106335 RepID=UPI001923A87F|nr:titin homolog isoform X3 [Hibiscus syriacus]
MSAYDKELELRLTEAGNRLVEPPSSVDELIPLLDQVESCLSRVEQSPNEAMQNALSPSLKALVADQLLRHPDNDVKVAVAACLSEITRITAPDGPYDEDQMREVFQLIVSSFENLSDNSSCSFIKRTSILETVAKVRSCVVMLDLECDALIIEMFQHFLKSIRDHHPETVFTSMATIMTLVLEESEDISVELLSPILACVKRDNQEVLPVALRMVEKVLGNCALKLKPYLMQAVESLGISFDEYSSVIASICQAAPSAVDQKDTVAEKLGDDENKPVESPLDKTTQEDQEIPEEAVSTEQVGLANERSPKSVVSNGTVQTAEDNLLTDSNSIKKQEDDHLSDKSNNDKTSTVAGTDRLVAENLVNSDSRSEESTLETEKTSDSKLTEPSDNVHVDEKEPETSLDPIKDSKDDAGSLRGDLSVEGAVFSENEQKTDAQPSSPKPTEDSTDVASPTPSGAIPDESHSEKAALPRTIPDDSHSEKAAQPMTIPDVSHSEKAAQPERKEGLSEETMPSFQDVHKKVTEGMSDSEVKTNRLSGKKVATVVSNKVNDADDVDETKKECGSASGSEAKSRTQSSKKVDSSSNNLDRPSRQLEDKKRRARGKVIPEKDGTKTATMHYDEEVVASPKSVKPNKHDSHMEENLKTCSKRKHTPNKEKASDSMEYGENLVGLKVKVWWPKDRAFYEGFIHSFDAVKKKHKVHYDDGDMEILNLKREKWKIIEDESEPDEEEAANNSSPDGSSETPQKKKAKTVNQPNKKTKMDALPKRGGGTSVGKSKSAVTKFGRKTKEDGKVDGKSKDVPKSVSKSDGDNVTKSKDHKSRSGSKSVDATWKVGDKTKNEDIGDTPKSTKSKYDGRVNPKASTKSKLDTPKASKSKSSSNSKGKPLKSSGKSNTNGTNKSKSGSSKVEESESMKENSTDSAKVVESRKRKSPSWNKAQASDAVSGRKQRQ